MWFRYIWNRWVELQSEAVGLGLAGTLVNIHQRPRCSAALWARSAGACHTLRRNYPLPIGGDRFRRVVEGERCVSTSSQLS